MEVSIEVIREKFRNPINVALLWKLRSGRAYTTIELANDAKATKTETENHLSSLIQDDLLMKIERRKRAYYRISNDEVAQTLQNYYKQTGVENNKQDKEKEPEGMKYCRTCYHHLAGKVGVLLTEKFRQKKLIEIGKDSHFILTPKGESFFKAFGIDTETLHQKRTLFAKACIDFSERKYHLGGALGRALFDKMLEKAWIEPVENSREIKITQKGRKAFTDLFQLEV